MDLKTFVTSALTQIAEAVVEANDKLEPLGAVVNPPRTQRRGVGSEALAMIDSHAATADRLVEVVKFDVAVVASESAESKGGLGVAIAVIGVGGSKASNEEKRSESRLQFSLPLMLPLGADKVKVTPIVIESMAEMQRRAHQ